MKRLWLGTLTVGMLTLCALLATGESTPAQAELATGTENSLSPAVTGTIGGYTEGVNEIALAVEASGRVHALWTGELNPYFGRFAFYSTSVDGVNWTPYQILSYWTAYEPQVVVDDVRQRAHLMYRSNLDGIIHHTAANGAVGEATVVDATGVVGPKMAVDPTTGYLHAVWRQGYEYFIEPDTMSWRYRTWYAYWDGENWSPRQKVINDGDTNYSSIAAAPGGGVMLAWFQEWSHSVGGPSDPGDPIVVRTAYGAEPPRFPLRQAVSDVYPTPEKDNSILLTYSAGDEAYVLACYHLMWPGHSRVYRYTWKDGVWSAPLNVAGNTSEWWAVPWFVGAASDSSLVTYVYTLDGELMVRTETDGVLGTAERVADLLAAQGYVGSVYGFFVDAAGGMHVGLAGSKNGVAGLYYVGL